MSRTGKPIGMVSTHWRELGHRPSEREQRFLDLLARQAADLIERQRAEQRIAADLEAVTRLQRAGALCARMDCPELEALAVLLDTAVFVTGAAKGNLQLLDSATGTLRIAAQRGFEAPFLEFFDGVTQDDAAASGAALDAVSRVAIPDVRESEVFRGKPALQVLLDAGVRAVQSTPLVSSSGRLLGMISTHYSEPHSPSERELGPMDLLARQAADYLERRQAEEALRQSEDKYRTLFETVEEGRASRRRAGGRTAGTPRSPS
jgi:GAF domain-containing protein